MGTLAANLLFFIVCLSVLVYPSGRFHRRGADQLLIRLFMAWYIVVGFVNSSISIAKIYAKTSILSGGVYISTIGPRTGTYILERDDLVADVQGSFNALYRDEMLEHRIEYRRMFVDHADLIGELPSHGEVVSDIVDARQTLERRYELGEVAIGIGGGILALLAGLYSPLTGFGVLISVYLVLFPISMLLRSAVVDALSFSGNPYDLEQEERRDYRVKILLFMKGWNEMLVRKQSVIHKLILASAVRGEFPEGYDLGQDIIDQAYAGEITVSEGIDDVVEKELGEETVESRWTRRLIKRFLGV